MPRYGTRDELEKLRKHNKCAECGANLNCYMDDKGTFIACWDYHRTHHEGITKEVEIRDKNIPTWRRELTQEYGVERETRLANYVASTSLTKIQAAEIINVLWPDAENASPVEVFKAITLCTQYGLNPLKKHLFLIPFWNTNKKRYDYVCVEGISANRLIASRKHHWAFLDDTPRLGTEAEEIKHYRKLDPDKLRAIAKIRDVDTKAEVTAWGEWDLWKSDKQGNKVRNEPKGIEKGNSMENMACVRAERRGLDMLYPADMPNLDVPVVDDKYEPMKVTVENRPSATQVNKETGEIIDVESTDITPEPEVKTEGKPSAPPVTSPQPQQQAENKPDDKPMRGPDKPIKIDMQWVKESLNKLGWADVLGYIKQNYGINESKVSSAIKLMNDEQQVLFYKEIVRRLNEATK